MVLNCCNELVSTGIDISLDINVSYTICDGSTIIDTVDSVWKGYLVVAKYSSDTTLCQSQNAQKDTCSLTNKCVHACSAHQTV